MIWGDGKQVSIFDKPEKIILSADRNSIHANGQDLSYVTVELLDPKGVRNPLAENLVQFEIDGPGSILAVGSSNPKSIESFKQPKRKAYQGRCLVIIKYLRYARRENAHPDNSCRDSAFPGFPSSRLRRDRL